MIKEFITAIHMHVDYWSKQNDRTEREKLEGLAFSILVMLDGCSGAFKGDMKKLEIEARNIMLHDSFYKVKS